MTMIIPSKGNVAKRVASPRNKKIGHVSSLNIARRAASSGGRTGTLYSSSNNFTANSNELYLRRPALKNTIPTPTLIINCSMDIGKRPSHARTDINHVIIDFLQLQ